MLNPQLPENNPTWVQSSPPCERCGELTRERDEARAEITKLHRIIGNKKVRAELAGLEEKTKSYKCDICGSSDGDLRPFGVAGKREHVRATDCFATLIRERDVARAEIATLLAKANDLPINCSKPIWEELSELGSRALIATYKQAIADAEKWCDQCPNARGTSVLRMIRAATKRGTEND